MDYETMILEGVLVLFFVLTVCLLLRTIILEAPATFHRAPSKAAAAQPQPREHAAMNDRIESLVAELKGLEMNGLTHSEIAALLHLKKWYQAGEGERAVLLSRWEFIKQLVLDGRLEV